MWFQSSIKIQINVINKQECFCQQLWKMILVNANYFKCVFASFSSVVKGSPGFLCNNETLHTYRLNTFSVVLNSFFFRFKASLFKQRQSKVYMYLLVSLNTSCKPVSNYFSVEMLISHCIPLLLGMLPLPGSSTFDPDEELVEPCLKRQRMEGE